MPTLANFEIFKNKQARPAGATLTIGRRGVFAISEEAHRQLGHPAAVELLYAHEERIIGLRPCDPDSPNAHKVRHPKGSKSLAISAAAFTRYYEIPHQRACRRTATLDGGVLCVRLADPGTPVTSNRAAD
jgi:hypothetical protein